MVICYENLLENKIPFITNWLLITIRNKNFMKLIQTIFHLFDFFLKQGTLQPNIYFIFKNPSNVKFHTKKTLKVRLPLFVPL
jgi:hypothetical protein